MLQPPSRPPLDVAAAVAVGDLWARLQYPTLDGDDVYWLDFDPVSGTSAVVRIRAGHVGRVTPDGVDVRSGVYEYGGGAYVVAEGTVVYSNGDDGRLYRVGQGALTPAGGGDVRYGDLALTGDAVVCVRERHEVGDVVNDLVRVPLDGSELTVVASGRDFYSFPCPSPDGSRLAWTAWDHPGMPFLGCELFCDGERLAGGRGESVFQPHWAPDGRLHYVSDRTGWWNLHVVGSPEPVGPIAGELGWPQWFLGLSSYAFLDDGRIAALVNREGEQRLLYLDPRGGWVDAGLPHAHVAWPYLRGDGRHVVFVGAEPGAPPELVVVDTRLGEHTVVQSSLEAASPIRATVVPERLAVPAEGCPVGGFFYEPPRPNRQPPPLVVLAHGGPTDQTVGGLRIEIELLVSHGYAVADVDYHGSTGHGRQFRERLAGTWGAIDVDDCLLVAETLAAAGRVDRERVAVMGGSAGGFLALCGVAFHDAFCAAVSLYGISDLGLWDARTHKFEASYTGWLVGSLDPDVLWSRSPVSSTAFSGPLLLLQGDADRVVTPDHLTAIAYSARAAGAEVESHTFPGEGHGFRRPEHVEAAYSAILAFLAAAFERESAR